MATSTIDPLTGLPKKSAAQPAGLYGTLDPAIAGNLLGGAGGFVPSGYSPAPGGASSINVGGFTPDYGGLINTDPAYLQLKGDLSAGGISDVASRNAALQRAVSQFGVVPDFSSIDLGALPSDINSIIDPATRALADSNNTGGISTEFRLDQAHQDAVRNITNALAAKGSLHSGEAGFQLGRENQAYGQAQNDATQKLLDYLSGVQAAYASNEQQRATALGQGASEAADRQAALPQNQPRDQQPATFNRYDASGKPVYVSADGKEWNPDGTTYTAPPAPDANSAGRIMGAPALAAALRGVTPGRAPGMAFAS